MKKGFLILLALIAALALSGCQRAELEGVIAKDDDDYTLTFGVLNMTDNHKLTLADGDALDVTISREAGRLDLLVTNPNNEAIYRGDNADSGAFQLAISEAGEYTCSVTGKDARGSVSFKVLRAGGAD